MNPLFGVLFREYMREMLTNRKNVPLRKFSEAVSYVVCALSFEDATDLYFLMLVQLGIEIISLVFLQYKGGIIGFGYAEWQYFHRINIAKY